MECPKCSGLMYMERVNDSIAIFSVWKCINCGNIIDKTIIENRQNSLAVLGASKRGPTIQGSGLPSN